MMRRFIGLLFVYVSLLPAPRAVNADEWLAFGPYVGYSLHQIALDRSDGPQTDLSYQFVTVGASMQLFGLREWVGVRLRGAAEFYQGLRIDDEPTHPGFWQMAVTAELLPTFTYMFDDIGITAGIGIGFTHYFEGKTPDSIDNGKLVAAQEQLVIPAFLGVTIEGGGVFITPEIGAAYAVWYATEAPDVQSALDRGSLTARGLDLWLRVSVTAPVL